MPYLTTNIPGTRHQVTETEKVTHILIIAGQSNAVGYTQLDNEIPAELQEQSTVKIFNGWSGESGEWEAYSWANRNTCWPNYAGGDPQWGWSAEAKAGQLLTAYYNDDVYIIKNAYGGENITAWDKDTPGYLWTQLEDFWTRSIGLLPDQPYIIDGILWMQGESDATEGIDALYEARLRTLIANIRILVDDTAVPFIIANLHADLDRENYPAIRTAYENIAADTDQVYIIYPKDEGATMWSIHYTASGLVTMGQAWYNFMLNNNLLNRS